MVGKIEKAQARRLRLHFTLYIQNSILKGVNRKGFRTYFPLFLCELDGKPHFYPLDQILGWVALLPALVVPGRRTARKTEHPRCA